MALLVEYRLFQRWLRHHIASVEQHTVRRIRWRAAGQFDPWSVDQKDPERTTTVTMFRSLFGLGKKTTLVQILASGALIIDVRTPEEFRQGHVQGSMNIPLDTMQAELKNLDKRRPIITCCRSGMRSGSAASLLTANGFMAHNGGSWQSVERHVLKP